jgi:fructokinase
MPGDPDLGSRQETFGPMRIGLDLGGTKIAAVALDEAGGELFAVRVPTPRDDYPGTLDAIAALVHQAESATGQTGTVGLGIPGSICPHTGLVKNANSDWLNGQPLLEDLQSALARPVRIANDANCFAVSEAVDGAGKGHRIVFGVILGTGAGAGLVIDRAVPEGPNGIGSEWGLNPLPWPTHDELDHPPFREAGRMGCIDGWVSGTGLQRDFARASGRDMRAPQVIAAAEDGDEQAEAALQRYEHRLARSLAVAINLFDPGVIILGGGMGKAERLYTNVPRLLNENDWVVSSPVRTPIVPPVHGDDSGKRGAAWLWLDGQ